MSELQTSTSGVTFRSLLAGALIAFCIGLGAPYGNMVLRGSYMALDFSTAGAIFLFFVFIFFVHTFLGLLHPRLAFHRQELAVVYIMGIVGCAIPTMGLTEYLLPIISGAVYYASPENEWNELIHPYIRTWLIPQDYEAVKYFYEGAPRNYALPWTVWLKPLVAWVPLVLSIYFSMICISVVLRKQWIERERLAFPLVQVPMAMIEDGDRPSIIKPFFKSTLMWIGFALPFIVGSLRALHNYYNFIPDVNLQTSIPLFRNTTALQIVLSFPMLGFSYFVNLEIAFAIWFFNLLARVQEGIFGILGIASTQKLYYAGSFPVLAHQGMGAMLVLAIFGLWTAKPHLKDVWRKAIKNDPSVDDSDEMLSYRTAVLGLLISNMFVCGWLWLAGMAWWVLPIYLTSMYLLFIAVTRVVAEGGIAAARAPLIASDFVTSGLGNTVLGPNTLTALGFTFVWAADIRTFVLASCANGLKLADDTLGRHKRSLFGAIALSILISMGTSIVTVLYLSYEYGGINLNGWFFGPTGGPVYPFNFISKHLNDPQGPNVIGWISTLSGGTVMGLLMLARQHFLWWPLHPLGFAVSTISMTNYISFSVFLAWLIKSLILRYGGPTLFQRARPFFLGLILGQFAVAGFWLIVDFFTGMTDNNIYWV
ncbi:MAG: hypothetical protein CME28_04605 [Gemmatimonadetes bacterium]|nr:hypothetical protein [Gemmatimonadota bacterium]|tara:strand:- start:6889 stop:8838 length:1950 start_codon:yes stop_codon:yes gene_type:complete